MGLSIKQATRKSRKVNSVAFHRPRAGNFVPQVASTATTTSASHHWKVLTRHRRTDDGEAYFFERVSSSDDAKGGARQCRSRWKWVGQAEALAGRGAPPARRRAGAGLVAQVRVQPARGPPQERQHKLGPARVHRRLAAMPVPGQALPRRLHRPLPEAPARARRRRRRRRRGRGPRARRTASQAASAQARCCRRVFRDNNSEAGSRRPRRGAPPRAGSRTAVPRLRDIIRWGFLWLRRRIQPRIIRPGSLVP